MPKQEPPPPNSTPKLSTASTTCRICYEGDTNETLITPCECKGSVGFVHRTCLQEWLTESNTNHCELCQQVFQTEPQNLPFWFISRKGFRSDVLLCTVITFFVIILLTFVCLFLNEYNHDEFVVFPAARWGAFALLMIMVVMLIGYYLWVWTVVRWHSRMWLHCTRREEVVQYVSNVNDRVGEDNQGRRETVVDVENNGNETDESDNK